ncbi:MAG TPA: alpha/beta fold hydrolase [Terriglobales bacterium]|nr:alpha/beta fold hydrolase [Terriglobales bacterium]
MTAPIEILAQSFAAERPRYTADLVFIPGLWCGSLAWGAVIGFLAHRGWNCTALELVPQVASAGWQDHLAGLDRHLAAYPDPPVLIGHDAGATLVLALPAPARARVALAPLLPQACHAALLSWRAPLSLRWHLSRRAMMPQLSGRLRRRLLGDAALRDCPPVSPSLLRDLAALDLQRLAATPAPTLIVSAAEDSIVAPAQIEKLATRLAASHISAAGAPHALLSAPGWDKRTGDIHRWLIKAIGASLLVPEDDE